MSAIAMVEYNGTYSAEWLMHYQVPHAELHKYHVSTLTVAPSLIEPAEGSRHLVGEGLYTTVDIKKDHIICHLPGCWVTSRAAVDYTIHENLPPNTYIFQLGDENAKSGLAYLTYPSQGNKINSTTYKDTVLATVNCEWRQCTLIQPRGQIQGPGPTEPLFYIVATADIKAGEELLADYGYLFK